MPAALRGPVLFLGDREWATGRFDGTVRTHAGPDGKVVQTLKGFKPPVGALAVSPDGRRLAAASYIEQGNQGIIRLWERATGDELGQATLTAPRVNALKTSPTGRFVRVRFAVTGPGGSIAAEAVPWNSPGDAAGFPG